VQHLPQLVHENCEFTFLPCCFISSLLFFIPSQKNVK